MLDFPLQSIHRFAFKAAEAAQCSGEQGKFWEMHDHLFANQQQLDRPDLSKHAQTLGLDVAAFDKCLDSEKSAPRIRKDVAEALKAQATGTPTFVVGLTDTGRSELKGTKMFGAQPYEAFKAAIEGLLTSQK